MNIYIYIYIYIYHIDSDLHKIAFVYVNCAVYTHAKLVQTIRN